MMAESGAGKEPAPEVTSDCIKVTAESISISTASEEACKFLADDVTFRLKTIVQDALKLAHHSKRSNLTTHDIDFSLKMKHYEPLYGFTSSDYIPFRNVSGGGRELYITADKEVDLDDITTKPLPKIPLKTTVKGHWLAIEGVQPAIPENPPPLSKDSQKSEGINPAVKASADHSGKVKTVMKKSKDIRLKPLTEHDLSVEQQLYYKEITEACVGSEEQRRSEALASLSQDPGLHKILPRIVTFISEGVKINCVNHNLAILIYLMRMLKSLLENNSLYLEKYLHELLPAVLTCTVSKQLCIKPESDNHWALRDFSSKIIGSICRKFSLTTNDVQTRVVKSLSEALQNTNAALTTQYGCIMALSELGYGVMQAFVIPAIKPITEKARQLTESSNSTEENKVTCQHLRSAIIKTVAPVLKATRKPPESLEAYRHEFGTLGSYLHEAVVRMRNQSAGGHSSLLYTSGVSRTTSTAISSSLYQTARRHGSFSRPLMRSSRIPCLSSPVMSYPASPYSPYHGMHYPRSNLPYSLPPRVRPRCWSGYNPRTQSGLTVQGQPGAVSRSFSLPMGARAGLQQPQVAMRSSATGQSLIKTPTTPSTPGSAPGSQKFIIVSTAAPGGGGSAGSSLAKVDHSSDRYNTQSPQPMTLTKALAMQAKAEAQAAGDDQSQSTFTNPSSDSMF